MAVMDKFKVKVISGGKALLEHDPPPDVEANQHPSDGKTVVKYIEAIPQANYEIKCSIKRGFKFGKRATILSFKIYIDGKWISSTLATKQKYVQTGKFSTTRAGAKILAGNAWKLHPFCWSELDKTDEIPKLGAAEIKELYGGLGTIRVEVWRGTVVKVLVPRSDHALAGNVTVPEKALKGKAIDFGTRLGAPREIEAPKMWDTSNVDTSPVAMFIFKYRTRNALQLIGVLPRSPTPVPLEERDPDTLTREEAVELVRRQQAQREAEKIRIKKEKAEEALRQLAAIKRGPTLEDDEDLCVIATPSKKPRLEPETVDLSD